MTSGRPCALHPKRGRPRRPGKAAVHTARTKSAARHALHDRRAPAPVTLLQRYSAQKTPPLLTERRYLSRAEQESHDDAPHSSRRVDVFRSPCRGTPTAVFNVRHGDLMGFLLALISSAAFGLIPLFSLPLLRDGMSAECVLFYRFLFGALALFPIPVLRHARLAAPPRELARLAVFSIMYALAALLMFQGFHYLPSGVASTLQFLYPLMVMIIMILFFHEKPSLLTACSVLLAILGVFLLSGGEGEGSVSPRGIVLLLVSALCNAVYICGLHVARIRSISGLSITFWVLFFGMLASLANALASGTFQWLHSWQELCLAVLLAVVTAAISNLALVLAIQRIGSTMTSILGVMEPLTAVTVGIFVFDEPATPGVFAGVAVICAAVLLVMAGPQLLARLRPGRA